MVETKSNEDGMLPLGFLNYLDNVEELNDEVLEGLPQAPPEFWKLICEKLIEKGAIPKKDLVIGTTYTGSCRNSDEATWLGDKFEYIRYKFGTQYKETINHFEDDDGYDLFVPLSIKDSNYFVI